MDFLNSYANMLKAAFI